MGRRGTHNYTRSYLHAINVYALYLSLNTHNISLAL